MSLLLVCAAPIEGSIELVARLAEEHDRVVGVDGGAGVCLAAGVVPHAVLGDLDSLDPDVLARIESLHVPVERYPVDKDLTDLDLALDRARTAGHDTVTVTAAFSGRLDHTLAAVGSLLRAAALRPRLVEPSVQGWLLAEGHRAELSLPRSSGWLSLLGVTADASVSAAGVRWPLVEHPLGVLTSLGVSNRILGESATVRVHRGAVLALFTDEALPQSPLGRMY